MADQISNRPGEEIQEPLGATNTDLNDENVPTSQIVPPQPQRRRPVYNRRTRRTTDLHYLQYDGYVWKRYDQRDIPNARHPRNYDRCFYKFSLGCQATRWVQMVDTNIPPLYRVTYIGKHTCDEILKKDRIEWLSLFMTFVTEGLSAAFEQLDKPFGGMITGIVGFAICIAEICYRARAEQVTVKWRGKLSMLYSQYPTYKVFGSTIQWFASIVAIWQCFHACLGYYYDARKNAQNPIKMSITMILLAVCLGVSKFVEWYSGKTYHTS